MAVCCIEDVSGPHQYHMMLMPLMQYDVEGNAHRYRPGDHYMHLFNKTEFSPYRSISQINYIEQDFFYAVLIMLLCILVLI